MKSDKSIEEIWKWKDEIYEENKNLSVKDYAESIQKSSKSILKSRNIKLKKMIQSHAVI